MRNSTRIRPIVGRKAFVAFAEEALVVKAQDRHRPPDEVVDDLLTLRGFGTTDLARALRVARLQLERSTAGRRLAIVLSDCRATAGEDPLAGLGHDELFVAHQGSRGNHHPLVGLHNPPLVKDAAEIQNPAQKR